MMRRLLIVLSAVVVSSAVALAEQSAFEEQLVRAGYGVEQRTCVLRELGEGGEAVDYLSLAEGLQEMLDLAEAQDLPIDDAAREEIIMQLAEVLPFLGSTAFGVGDPDAMKALTSVSAGLLSNCLTLQD